MNSLVKKALIFVAVMAAVAGIGWFGRKAYKHATERRLLTEARQYLEKKDLRNAGLCLQRAFQISPMSGAVSTSMANLLEATGVPEALAWRLRAAQLEPLNMTNRLQWARTALEVKDLKSASEALAGVDAKTRATAASQKLEGALAWAQGHREEADEHYQTALRIEPGNPSNWVNLETIRLSSTNVAIAAGARSALEGLCTNAMLRPAILRQLLKEAAGRNDLESATRIAGKLARDPAANYSDKIDYLQILRVGTNHEFSPWLEGLKSEAAKSPPEAFALSRWIATTDGPTNALRWIASLPQTMQTNQPIPLVVADCRVAMKDWKGLMEMLDQQDWGEANFFRVALQSLAQRSQSQDLASQTSWRKAARLADRRLDRMSRLAQVTGGWGWKAENTELVREITLEFPKEKWASEMLMQQLYVQGNTRELGELLSRISAEDPADLRLKNNLANVFLLRKLELNRAYRLAKEAYESAPANPFFTATYAYSLLLQSRLDEALKVVGNLKPEQLEIPSVAAYYGLVQAQSGHKEMAKSPLERAAGATLLPEEKELVRLAMARL